VTCVCDDETKKRQRKKPYSGKLGIHPDHPCRPMEMPFGKVGGLPAVAISFKFHQHGLSGYPAVRGRNLAHLIT